MDTQSDKKYDVAISFLVEDLSLAQALYDRLSEGLEVFFFPRNQEDLAGTNGLESMREPFAHQSKLNLVLYRDKWGTTPWTGVESAAIQEACLQNHFEGIFFFVIEPTYTPPRWLPRTHVRFNYADFALEQAVGAIKARVQELGGKFKPLTAARKAELFEAEEAFRRDKARMSSQEGLNCIQAAVESLFEKVGQHCREITEQGRFTLRFASDTNQRNAHQTCGVSSETDGANLTWIHPYSNSLDKSELVHLHFEQRLLIGDEVRTHFYLEQPKAVKTTRYIPSLSRLREYGWSQKGKEDFISSSKLAELLVIDFLESANKHAERRDRSR